MVRIIYSGPSAPGTGDRAIRSIEAPSTRIPRGQDPGVDCLSFSAMALCFLGYPEKAVKRIAEAVDLARQLAQPFSVAYALTHAAVVHHMCRDVKAAKQWAEAAIAVVSEHEFTN